MCGVGYALCLGGFFGQTHRGNLGCGEHRGRDDVEVYVVLLAKDVVQCTITLECGGMSQLAQTVDVAHGIDVGQGGLHILVHADALGGVGDTDVVKVERGQVGTSAYSH